MVPGPRLKVWAMMPAWFTLSEACVYASVLRNQISSYRWSYCPLVFSLCPVHKDLGYRAHTSTATSFLPLSENAASLERCSDRQGECLRFWGCHSHDAFWFFFFTLVLPIFHFLCFWPMSGPTLFAWEKHKLGYYQFAFYK